MDEFAYLSVLLSIIIGLGITQLLTAAGRLIRHRDRVRVDWLPLLWAAVLLVIFVQVWWSMFGLRTYREWTFVGFLLILAQTCTLYLMAAVVLPEQVEDAVDLATHYERQHRWFFGFFLATLIISVAKDLVINGQWPSAVNLGFHIFLAVVCLSAITVRKRRYQEVVGIAGSVAVATYIGLLFMRLR
jgi:Ca2+/Na+ antiporter